MSENQTVKVYELAKELGIDSISLLDKLKSLNIKVKNHMSELRDEEVQIARTSLKRGAEHGAEKGHRKVQSKSRKKSADSSSSAHAAGETPQVEKKAASPIIRR